MTGSSPNTLSNNSVEQELANMKRRIRQLEAIVQGQPIRSARIEDVSGGKVNSGTIIIKDGVDGSEISVRDMSNVEIGRVDENGFTIHAGDVNINNVDGDPTFDGLGLVSENNFVTDTVVSINNARTTSSTTFTNVPITNLSFTLVRDTMCLLFASGNFASVIVDGEICSIDVGIAIDGVLYPNSTEGFGTVFVQSDLATGDVTNCLPTWSGTIAVMLPAGTHTAWLQYRKDVASIDAGVTNTTLSYLLLGK